ncbi:hypothetical protein [Limnohabitans sp. 2KL-27]|uniref:hypothetical protein n=1 Tax=Limnohabitans sp. 2KL-27 TaxID=1100705 RepID=UPI000AC020CA|nr:hypothetical protein [Limnohabitans sp. 2KL-27]
MTTSLLVLLLLPSILMVTLSLPSLAIGLVISSAIIIIIKLIKGQMIKITKIYFLFSFIAFLWIFVNPISIENLVHAKQVLSLLAIVLCGFALTSIFNYKQEHIKRTVGLLFLVLLVIGFIGVFEILKPGSYQTLNRPLPPFSEPSHFAINFIPIACFFAFLSSNKLRILTCLACSVLALFLPNLTLMVGVLLISLIVLKARQFVMVTVIIIGLIALIVLFMPSYMDYFINRVIPSDDYNLSYLVYIQGWEQAISALQFSSGFGVGFQNFGIEPPGQASHLIDDIFGFQINRTDGGFLASKFIGEFGIVGIALVGYTSILSIRAGLLLRKHLDREILLPSNIISLCYTYIFLLELFIRSISYFSITFLITLLVIPKTINILKKTSSLNKI